MSSGLKISQWCRINEKGLKLPGESFAFTEDGKSWKELYQYLGLQYSKIFKMDSLCKWSYLAVEALKKKEAFKGSPAIYFVNSHASFDADQTHLDAVNGNGEISPAVFVYTLPNIAIGELAIANQWHSSSQCEVMEKFDPAYLVEELKYFQLMNSSEEEVLFIWADVINGVPDVLVTKLSVGIEGDLSSDLDKKYSL